MNKQSMIPIRSIAASLMIGLGDYVLLTVGNPFGPFLFSLGLILVCYFNLLLFTGKCGFYIEDNMPMLELCEILLFNLIGGYAFGFIFSFADPALIVPAIAKVESWSCSPGFFIRSMLCGVVMFGAVGVYKYKKSPIGILIGIPLFIFCGFQHCIANIITLGIARTWDWSILLCISGNFLGSLITWCMV